MDELTHIIDGKHIAGERWFDSVNPTTQHPWARVAPWPRIGDAALTMMQRNMSAQLTVAAERLS